MPRLNPSRDCGRVLRGGGEEAGQTGSVKDYLKAKGGYKPSEEGGEEGSKLDIDLFDSKNPTQFAI